MNDEIFDKIDKSKTLNDYLNVIRQTYAHTNPSVAQDKALQLCFLSGISAAVLLLARDMMEDNFALRVSELMSQANTKINEINGIKESTLAN